MNNMVEHASLKTKAQLCLMMFLQYMLSAVWWVPLGAYLQNGLKFEPSQMSFILISMAIGAMASAFIGSIADRYFPGEKILSVLNLLTAVFLVFAAQQTAFAPLMGCVVGAMLCHMPTQSLTSTIAMHILQRNNSRASVYSVRLVGSLPACLVWLHSVCLTCRRSTTPICRCIVVLPFVWLLPLWI